MESEMPGGPKHVRVSRSTEDPGEWRVDDLRAVRRASICVEADYFVERRTGDSGYEVCFATLERAILDAERWIR
jgi:hypothetical protein